MGHNNYLVSISMPTFNQKQYIEKAVVSCLSQKTSFPFQLVISDDCSTDGTVDILKKFAAQHNNIKLILHEKNCIYKNYTDLYDSLRTKYVAFCDGDDFWTDDHKLETQVSFLEAHPDFSVSAHKTEVLMEGTDDPFFFQPIYKKNASKKTQETGILYADEIADNYYLHVSSYVLRWIYTHGLPSDWETFMTNDHFLLLVHAAEGKIKYFDKSMSVWRRHYNGYTSLQTKKASAYIREKWDDFIELQARMDRYFEGRFHYQLQERVRFALHSLVKECKETGDWGMLDFFLKRYAKEFHQITNRWSDIVGAVYNLPRAIEDTVFPIKQDFKAPPDAHPADEAKVTIGGRIPLALDMIPEVKNSVWQVWTSGHEYACFHNYESALSSIQWNTGLRVWLPDYCFRGARRLNIDKNMIRVLYYSVSDTLSCLDNLFLHIQSGDMVLTHSYFGRPVAKAFRQACAARPDIVWIEDRTSMLDPLPSEAQYVIYTPPSVLGTPDGAVILSRGAAQWSPLPRSRDETRILGRLHDAFLDYEIPGRNILRARAVPTEEQQLKLSREAMSKTTLSLLRRLPYPEISVRCKENWRILFTHLEPYALWNWPEPDFTPSAFPILTPKRTKACRLASFLADEGILFDMTYDYSAAGMRRYEGSLDRLCAVPCTYNYTVEQMDELGRKISSMIKSLY